jgi:hypothetical protein
MRATGVGLFLLASIAAGQQSAHAAPVAANLSAAGFVVRADWQEPNALPPRFRNHCQIDRFSGRPFCASHCGLDYQFFYCSRASSGCCHIGRGYCGWDGLLRCSP